MLNDPPGDTKICTEWGKTLLPCFIFATTYKVLTPGPSPGADVHQCSAIPAFSSGDLCIVNDLRAWRT